MCECDPLRGILCGYHRAQKETDRRPPALPSDEEMADVRAWNDLTARAERAEAAEADLRATVDDTKRERDKLAATIAAYLGTDERAVHDAANLAHARDQRDALRATLARVHRLAVGWQEPVLSFVSVYYPDAATALLAALDAERPAFGSPEWAERDATIATTTSHTVGCMCYGCEGMRDAPPPSPEGEGAR